MAVGKVKWFNDEKGWGFIKQDTGPDVFVHYSQIQQPDAGRKRLFEDETVEFEIKEGPKGLQAINVMRLAAAS
ncbi:MULTISPECIES: cold-shock protein [Polyangium]|uniref:Cold-shock protein n=1 Tax=Polyangium jinanense TaxID=2829994 RepID=A0A9X3XCQ8_9BACT|nr:MULTISPECIES: cold-shock protein [Polyangium]MDC3957120.1 cold-shock protein [Polyangium jinanense]MDC3986850.1 cold-shock protein [Polyangium jinanense]MDI3288541.1 cold-shock protein [Polyangium sp. 15x6]